MKKKILSFILALLMLLGSVPITLLSAFAQEVSEAIDPSPKISITPITVRDLSGGAAMPDASGDAYFLVEADTELEEDVTVYYKTSDLSAVAESGDYEAASGFVILTPQTPQAQIVVKTFRTEYAVLSYIFRSLYYWEPVSYESRRFEVVLTGVEGSDAVLDTEKSRAECVLNSKYTFEALQYTADKYTFVPFLAGVGDHELINVLSTPIVRELSPYTSRISPNFPTNWLNYMSSEVDAALYMALRDAYIAEGVKRGDAEVQISIGTFGVNMYGRFDNGTYLGWGSAFVYQQTGNKGEDEEHLDSYLENFGYMRWTSYDNKSVMTALTSENISKLSQYNNTSRYMTVDYLLANKHMIVRDTVPYWTSSGMNPANYYVAMSDINYAANSMTLRVYNEWGERYLKSGDIVFRLEDIKAPKIEETDGVKAVYHNFDTATAGEKFRLTVRLTEPIQLKSTNIGIVGKVNGKGKDALNDPYAMRFNYVGGNGTDTLYFESEYNGEYNITSVTDLTFINSEYIIDYADVSNTLSAEPFTLSGFSVDRRYPVINVDNTNYVGTSASIRSTDVEVTVANISEGAVLQYSWTDSEKTPETYENEIPLDNVSVNETQTLTVSGSGDGKKYLHLRAVSKYQRHTTTICNSKTGMAKSYLGPYYFDNSAPTFDVTVSPTEESDLSKKVYNIPFPKDNPSVSKSGLDKVEMYYKSLDGEILVATFTEDNFKTVSGYKESIPFTLNASDVGIGEKTRVDNAEVYFVLTDKLGNTATGISRHSVVFDTNEYINVLTPGTSSSLFTNKTNKVDANTLTYSNDKTALVDGETVYYSFEIKIKEDAESCTNVYTVTKIGDSTSTPITEGHRMRTVTDSETGVKTVILEFTSPIENGCYEIQLLCYDAESQSSEKADRVTEPYRVYIGTGGGKLSEKINAGTMLINKVYQLPAGSSFTYMGRADSENGTADADKVLTEYYNIDRLAMSFSSIEQARKFVLFNEYRDLNAIVLTESLADALNSRTTVAQPAQGEFTEAKAGQVWIRYKSLSWTTGSKQESHWVYYYYGITDVLNPENFSSNLKEALNYVTDMITNSGKTVALTDLSLKNGSGASLLDKTGTPYLAPSQIVTSDLNIIDSTTKTSVFTKEITFLADTAIYSSSVVKTTGNLVEEYTLIGNLTVPLGSRFQYRKYNSIGQGYVSETWQDIVLNIGNGTERFFDVIADDGWYEIRELGTSGTTLYDVYIDKKAPSVSVAWNDKNGSPKTQWLNADSENNFRAGSFEITALDSLEADRYSYVAIYNMLTSELLGAYTMTEIQRASVRLADGRYYMIVSDRSGNSYYMSLYINSSVMNCNVEETENIRIKFTCDRDSSQIQTFYVKRNGARVDNVQYSNTITFTQSGTYEFYVEDIYGNSFGPYVYEFTREYPEITWSYLIGDGYFEKYDENKQSNCFILDKLSDGSYRIISSAQMRFQMTGDYVYEFIGTAPDVTKNEIYNYVTINSAQSFQLKVAYRDHPDVYTIYNCSADKNAPNINVSSQAYTFEPLEVDFIEKAISENGTLITTPATIVKNGVTVNGKFITPPTIAYEAGKIQTRNLHGGETVLSDFINVNISDENGVYSVKIYLDGTLIKSEEGDVGSFEIVLNRYGEYLIEAVDMLGNVSEFTFKNESPDAFVYSVDGKAIELSIDDYKNFNKDLEYTAVNYGNSSVCFTVYEDMEIFYAITDVNGEKKMVAFDVVGNTIRSLKYFLSDGASVPELYTGDVLFDLNAALNPEVEYPIYEDKGTVIFAKAEGGNIVLKVYAKSSGIMTVEARISTEGGEFYYNKTELSKLPLELDFEIDGVIKEDVTSSGQLNVNKPFEILTNANTETVEVYFSKLNDLDSTNLSGKDNIYGQESYGEEGFYLVRATDKYGNETVYRIHLSDDFDVTPFVEYSDGHKIHYSPEYKKTLYSNFKIVFELHSDEVVLTVKKDGALYNPMTVTNDGITIVTLNETGNYTLSFSDAYGNIVNYSANIDTATVSFNENLLTGYNENALRKDEGYTNQKLSVSEVHLADIYYLAIRYGEDLTVIYDALNESTVSFVSEALKECVGNSGDGEYTVIVRNKYGAIATKTVHFRMTPTLKLERETRNSTKPEPYSLADAISIGFWSNNSLSFSTEALVYEFTINKDKTECPKTIFYGNSGQLGRNEYEITYIDEYGFSYSFNAYLSRQELEINLSDGVSVQNINDILTTKDDISVIFSDNAVCTYTLNNSEPKIYTKDEKLTKDGLYRFTVTDYSGNVSAFTVKKDTVVEFYFKSNNSPTLKSGEVVNYSKVEFSALNGDTAYIEKVLKNGTVQQNYNGTIFTEDGKWEIIVADKLGNKSYFNFYIISREQNGFAYTTPYEYHITEMWYEGIDGVKISYMNFVNHTEFTSSFDFKENGKYFATMASDVTGAISTFEFTVNTNAPKVYLVGCEDGGTTINDVTVSGYKSGDRIKVYKITETGETLVSEVEMSGITSQAPIISEGGEYRIVVESEAGVATELNFVRKHIMNTAGSVFIMVIVGIAAAGLFAGLIYRNKSKTDD